MNKFEVIQPNDLESIEMAVSLVNSFYAKKIMLEANLKLYEELASEGKLVIATNQIGEIIGTAGYTAFYPGDIWEFGGWAVDEKYQGQGVGMSLLSKLFTLNPHGKTIAFGNKNSAPLFEKLGGIEIPNGFGLPKEVFGPCATCPAKTNNGCCDTIYHLGPVVAKYGLKENKSSDSLIQMEGWNQFPQNW